MADVNRTLTFSIEELRLEGVAPFERYAIAEALEHQLGQLFAARGVPSGLSAGLVPTPAVVDPTGLGPAELGRSIAVALYEGWA